MKKKILLIEDDQPFANSYRNRLQLDGFEVELAYDGETGLEKLHRFSPDLVLLDLILPRMHGVEVIRKVRSEPAFKALPLLVFTNSYLTALMQEASEAGATRCLTKANCTTKELVGAIRSLLNRDAAAPEATGPADTGRPGAEAGTRRSAAPTSPSLAERDLDSEFQAELKKMFLEGLPGTLSALRSHLQALIKSDGEQARSQHVQHLYRRVHSFTSNAGLVGMSRIAQLADALEALLRELHENPGNLNASTLRTVASAIDFLDIVSRRDSEESPPRVPPAEVLVVDDEAISRRAIVYALDKAKLPSVSLEDPVRALEVLDGKHFDLIFLDVDMPRMNGYELCSRVRGLSEHKKTPIVFVTSLTDFESRANSSVSGGNDFIAKPFMFIELAVKALVHVFRNQVESDPPKLPAATSLA
jgi:DNA-binding response OmpR family regulator